VETITLLLLGWDFTRKILAIIGWPVDGSTNQSTEVLERTRWEFRRIRGGMCDTGHRLIPPEPTGPLRICNREVFIPGASHRRATLSTLIQFDMNISTRRLSPRADIHVITAYPRTPTIKAFPMSESMIQQYPACLVCVSEWRYSTITAQVPLQRSSPSRV
jgi:hypothetical protein